MDNFGLDQGSQTRSLREGPMRPANNKKNEEFKAILRHFALFLQYINFELKIKNNFFQCGPRDLSLSLVRPLSHFEFETPGVDVKILKTQYYCKVQTK